LAAEGDDALAGEAAVGLDLLFARAPHADAGAAAGLLLGGDVGAELRDAGQRILELRELDLQLRLVRARVGGEDVEDELGAVDDLAPDVLLEVGDLAGGELVVEDDGIDVVVGGAAGELGGLPLTYICAGI